jgi:hypothetical protein
MGWTASMGRLPRKGRTWRRSQISVAASVVGLRLGSVDHIAHHSPICHSDIGASRSQGR